MRKESRKRDLEVLLKDLIMAEGRESPTGPDADENSVATRADYSSAKKSRTAPDKTPERVFSARHVVAALSPKDSNLSVGAVVRATDDEEAKEAKPSGAADIFKRTVLTVKKRGEAKAAAAPRVRSASVAAFAEPRAAAGGGGIGGGVTRSVSTAPIEPFREFTPIPPKRVEILKKESADIDDLTRMFGEVSVSASVERIKSKASILGRARLATVDEEPKNLATISDDISSAVVGVSAVAAVSNPPMAKRPGSAFSRLR